MAAASPFPPPPVLTPQGLQQWWVVNQPSQGPRQASFTQLSVVESTTRPVNAVAGPFSTQAEAQAFVTSANTAGNSPGSAVGGTVNAASSALNPFGFLSQASFWLRVGEVVVGVVLLAIGLNAMLKGRPLAVVTDAAAKAAVAVPKLWPSPPASSLLRA